MARKIPQPAPRKPRSDAQRNRERILEVAKEAFTRSGADTTMDEIARRSGVGAGTLYRHFPTRDVLIEAVYRTEVEKLAAAQRRFSEKMPPIEALRAWMLLFLEHIAAKHIIAPALNTIMGGPARLYEAARSDMQKAVGALIERGIKSGQLRKDLDPLDLLLPLIGFSSYMSALDWRQSGKRLVDILITGSRRAG